LYQPGLYIFEIFFVIRSLNYNFRALVEPGKFPNSIGYLRDAGFGQFYRFEVQVVNGQYPLFAVGFGIHAGYKRVAYQYRQ
jgi:hypothetical protein